MLASVRATARRSSLLPVEPSAVPSADVTADMAFFSATIRKSVMEFDATFPLCDFKEASVETQQKFAKHLAQEKTDQFLGMQ